jgi:thymidylate kinase
VDIYHIFKEVNKSELHYVLMTGNADLEKAFNGKGDFDILIDKKDSGKFEILLLKLGFKRRISTFNNYYFGVDNFLYYDNENEKTHHFHIHYEVIFGPKNGLNYYFKDSNIWFGNSYFHNNLSIRIVNPEVEYVFLVLRILVSGNNFKKIKSFIKGRENSKYVLKHSKLIKLVNEDKLKLILSDCFQEFQNIISIFYKAKGDLSVIKEIFLEKKTKKILYKNLRVHPLVNDVFNNLREESKKVSSHALSTNGKIISLIGVDGAGKSTLSNEIKKWLDYKLSARNIFLGQVKKSKINWILRKVSKVFKVLKLSSIANYIKDYTHIINAKFRFKGVEESHHLTQRGYYIVTDRYPLKEFWNMDLIMDGPKLRKKSALYKKERNIYNRIDNYPHLIIILKIPIEVSISRKPEEHSDPKRVDNLKKKIKAITSIENLTNVIVVDATQSYEAVKKEVKSIIWKNIN